MKSSACLLLIGMLLVCGCSDKNEKKLLGRWQETSNPKGALIFASDHSGRAYWPDEAGAQQGSAMKWELLKGGDRVAVITPPGPVYFEIKADKLVAPNGVVLTKVK